MSFFCYTFLLAASLLCLSAADDLATITPCPQASPGPQSPAPITVTSQYQEVSSCSVTSVCSTDTCRYGLSYSTWKYVSTTIPCEWNDTHAKRTLVTETDQPITISASISTETASPPQPTNASIFRGYNTTVATNSSNVSNVTITRSYIVPYDKIGPLAIPGYQGSGLCDECEVRADGSFNQAVTVIECTSGLGRRRCVQSVQDWVSFSAPATSRKSTLTVSTSTILPSTGAYTFEFTHIAPVQTFSDDSTTWTAGPHPYTVSVTKTCTQAPQTIDMTRTVTKTITFTAPPSVRPVTVTTVVPLPTGPRGSPIPHPPHPNGPKSQASTTARTNAGYPYAESKPGDVSVSTTVVVPVPSPEQLSTTTPWGDWLSQSTKPVVLATTTVPSISSSTDPHWADWHPGSSVPTLGTLTTSSTFMTPASAGTPEAQWGDWPSRVTTTSARSLSIITITSSTTTTFQTSLILPIPSSVPGNALLFYIQLDKLGTRFRRSAPSYIMFDGEDAYLTLDKALAALFYLVEGVLYHAGRPVGTTATSGAAVLELLEQLTDTARGWSRNGDDLVFAPAGSGFCVTDSQSVIVQLTASPKFQCSPYGLRCENRDGTHPTPTYSTTAFATSSSTSMSASTTHSPDPSADMEDEPLPTDVYGPYKPGYET